MAYKMRVDKFGPIGPISFRPFSAADIDTLLCWASTADDLLQWSGPLFSFPLDEMQLREYAASAGESRHLISGIRRASGEVVAHAELNLLRDHDLGQIRRVAVAPEERGRGIGLALINWLVKFAFEDLDLNRLELDVFSHNEPAIRCYEAAGLRREGLSLEARKSERGYWSLIRMALLRSLWCASNDQEETSQ